MGVSRLRPPGFDELGLRRAVSDRMLPLLVGAMVFLAALALAGWSGSAALSQHWREGVAASLTVQVPAPREAASHGVGTRLSAVIALLSAAPVIASAHTLSEAELDALLKPWVGQAADTASLAIPAVIAVRVSDTDADLRPLTRQIQETAPGTEVEDNGEWIGRLALLTHSLQACAALTLLLVAGVAAAVVAVATRAGLASRREAIEIVHGLGATDGYIAGRFAARATRLATVGGAAGVVVAAPVLVALAAVMAPFTAPAATLGFAAAVQAIPASLWVILLCLPPAAGLIGFVTAQTAVRRWLRRLP